LENAHWMKGQDLHNEEAWLFAWRRRRGARRKVPTWAGGSLPSER